MTKKDGSIIIWTKYFRLRKVEANEKSTVVSQVFSARGSTEKVCKVLSNCNLQHRKFMLSIKITQRHREEQKTLTVWILSRSCPRTVHFCSDQFFHTVFMSCSTMFRGDLGYWAHFFYSLQLISGTSQSHRHYYKD